MNTEELSAAATVILFGNCIDFAGNQSVSYYEQYELFYSFPQTGIWDYPGNGDYRHWILRNDTEDRNPVWNSGRPVYLPALQSRAPENHGLLYGPCRTVSALYGRHSERNRGSGYGSEYSDCSHSSLYSSEKDCEIEYHK